MLEKPRTNTGSPTAACGSQRNCVVTKEIEKNVTHKCLLPDAILREMKNLAKSIVNGRNS